jgi:hypothetical protein
MRFFLSLSLLALVACGDSSASPCQTAVDAQTACLDQAGVSYDADKVDQAQTACVALLIAKPGFGSWVECQTSAFDGVDCSTPEAAQSAIEASAACGNPLE